MRDAARILLDLGSDIQGRDNDNNTVLHVSARRNFKELAELLISYGADLNFKNFLGETPLHRRPSWL